MQRAWVSVGSTTTGSVVDPICAACERGFVPDKIYFISNPSIGDEMPKLEEVSEGVVSNFDVEPEIDTRELESETDFDALYEVFRDCVEEAQDAGADVAVNFTPGRKFMTAIAFQTGSKLDVEHLYYFHIHAQEDYYLSYPEIPRTAADLIDFKEEM